jgi:hypothetical protein
VETRDKEVSQFGILDTYRRLMMIKRSNYLMLTSTALMISSGCASVLHGTKQKVPVASVPTGANVMIQGVQAAVTPGIVKVARGDKGVTLRFEKEGFKPVDVVLQRKLSAAVWGNIAIGGVIGLLVDFTNGAAYRQTPDQLTATMDALSKTPTLGVLPAHPTKDTIVVVFREKVANEKTGDRLAGE